MQPTLKAAVFAFATTILFSSVNFGRPSQPTFIFNALNASQSKSSTILSTEPYLYNPDMAEVTIAHLKFPGNEVSAVMIDLGSNYKVRTLKQIMRNYPDVKLVLDEERAQIWGFDKNRPQGGGALWTSGGNIKLDFGNGNVQSVSDVTKEYIREVELSTGVYKGVVAKMREVIDKMNCNGQFSKTSQCQTRPLVK